MGGCDSSMEYHKNNISKNTIQDLKNTENFSSSSMPLISSSVLPETNDNLIGKNNNSTDKSNPIEDKQYILSYKIAKREDVLKKYIISKKVLGDGATAVVYLAQNSSNQKFALKRIIKEKIIKSSFFAI